ncbi:MAG: sterol desaturase family protein [Moraxellaceae bacterium]|nr:sterol desaturase family protein [Moraxellaceae bacterium]
MTTVAIVLAAALMMMALEWWRPARRVATPDGWRARAVSLNLLQAGSVFITAATWDAWLPALAWQDGSQWSLGLQVTTGYLLITFVYYWWHRARHEVPLLWRWLHQLHHSPARIEVLTSFYKHPLEILANGFLSAFLLHVLLGLTPTAVAIVVLVTGLAELFYHWNVRTPYWLGFLFQRPESHCVHHRRHHHRQNYSDLPLWDMLFGTFHNPRDVPAQCGFDAARETQLLAMLAGRDLHASHRSQ